MSRIRSQVLTPSIGKTHFSPNKIPLTKISGDSPNSLLTNLPHYLSCNDTCFPLGRQREGQNLATFSRLCSNTCVCLWNWVYSLRVNTKRYFLCGRKVTPLENLAIIEKGLSKIRAIHILVFYIFSLLKYRLPEAV